MCSVIEAVASSMPKIISDQGNFCVTVHYQQSATETVEAVWRGERWLWVLREKSTSKIKGCGYCETAKSAFASASTAASFANELLAQAPSIPEPPLEVVMAATA